MIVVQLVFGNDGGWALLIYSCKVDEKHMHAAAPVICLTWGAFEDDGWVLRCEEGRVGRSLCHYFMVR